MITRPTPDVMEIDREVKSVPLFHATDLFQALVSDDIQRIEWLLSLDPHLAQARDRRGNSPLHIAASQRSADAVRLLLAYGADIDGRDAGGATALHIAVMLASLEMVNLLLEQGADVEARTKQALTPQDIAQAFGRTSIAGLLRAAPASWSGENRSNQI